MKTEYAVIHEPNGDQTRLIGELTHRREIADEIALNTFLRLGGRYLSNPVESPDQWGHYRVSYEYEDAQSCNEHQRRWRRVTEDVREVRKDQWWRIAGRRLRRTLGLSWANIGSQTQPPSTN